MSNSLQFATIDLSTVDNSIDYLVISNVSSLVPDGVDRFLISGVGLRFEPNLPLTDNLRNSLLVVVENYGHLAFGHYFFESVLFAKSIWDSYGLGEDAIALLTQGRKFKYSTMDFVGLKLSRDILPNSKILLIRRQFSLNSSNNEIDFKEKILWFSSKYVDSFQSKTRLLAFMPRQNLENFHANDRSITYSGFDSLLAAIPDSVVVNTDSIGRFEEQLALIRSSKFVVVSDGSAFLVNGFFLRNCTIIVLGTDFVLNQSKIYSKIKIIYDFIKSRNNVIFIRSNNNSYNASDLMPILRGTYLF